MLEMQIESLVNDLVEQFLVKPRGNEKGLHFGFRIYMSHYTSNKIYGQSVNLHVLYYLQHGYTYVNMFSAITDRAICKAKDIQNWKHEVTHDSCWRSHDLFPKVYFDLADKINKQLVADGLPQVAPKEFAQHNSNILFNDLFDWVDCAVTKDQTDPHNYRRVLEIK